MADTRFNETVQAAASDFARLREYVEIANAPFADASAHDAAQPLLVDLAANHAVRETSPGVYAIHTMEDLQFLAKHPDVENAGKYLGTTRPSIPAGFDGEKHRNYRRLLDPVFTPRRIESLAPRVRELALSIIDGFIDDGHADVYREWCEPLPASIFLSIMGLPLEDLGAFFEYKRLILANDRLDRMTVEERASRIVEGTAWIQDYFTRAFRVREGEASPRDDMIGWLLSTEVDGERLTHDDLLDILGALMIAGLDTVASSLANILSYLARNPDQLSAIVADPALIPSAVEELMRWATPAAHVARLVNKDVTLPSGTVIPAGSVAILFLSSANVDPKQFPEPLTVDFRRAPNRHVAFSTGFHRCLGSHLARLELRVALEAWHERIPHYQLAPGADLVFHGSPRAPHQLPLVWS
jgi:cytochrome P450